MTARSDSIKQAVGLEWVLADSGVLMEETGNSLRALCPFHPDTNPSFYIYQNAEGVERYGCWSCGAKGGGTVIDWVMHHHKIGLTEAMDYLENLDTDKVVPPRPRRTKHLIVLPELPDCEAKHTYRNPDGSVLGIVCRRPRHPWFPPEAKGVPFVLTDKKWECRAMPEGSLPYNWMLLPDGGVPVIVEGESTADALAELGICALSWAGGAQAWCRTDWSILEGHENVIISADANTVGRDAATLVSTEVRKAGCTVRLILPPGESGEDLKDLKDVMVSKETVGQWMAAQNPQILEPIASDGLPDRIVLDDDGDDLPDAETTGTAKPPPPEGRVSGGNGLAGESLGNNRHFRVHGMAPGNIVVIYQCRTKSTLKEPAKNLHTLSGLCAIHPYLDWWETMTGTKMLKKTDILNAGNLILQEAHAAGLYMAEHEFPRGSMLDGNGDEWWNHGDILTDPRGSEVDLDGGPTGTVCQATPGKMTVRPIPNSDLKRVKAFWHATAQYAWRSEADHIAFAGWLIASVHSGTLKWRPHLWLAAPSTAGKTWLMKETSGKIIELLGGKQRCLSGITTFAGFKRVVGNETLPLQIDEARKTGKSGVKLMDEIFGFARLASDGVSPAVMADKNTHSDVVIINPKCAMLFASNIAPLLADQDKSRITTVRLNAARQPPAVWEKTEKAILDAMAEPELLTGEMMGCGAQVRELTDVAHRYLIAECGTGTRRADQLAPLAGASALAKNPTAPDGEIPALADRLLTLTKEVMGDSAQDAFFHLLNARVDMNAGGKQSVAQLICRAPWSHTGTARLAELGIKVRANEDNTRHGIVGFHLKASQLLAIMRPTIWGDTDLEPLFLDLPGAYKHRGSPWRLASEAVRPVIVQTEPMGIELKDDNVLAGPDISLPD